MAVLKPAADRVADEIAGLIASGHYRPGDALPVMSQIQDRQGLSRSTVQRAFRILTGRGLVNGQQGKGMFVSGAAPKRHRFDAPRNGCIYVISFTSGLLKVGVTTRPRKRLAQHASDARMRGDQVAHVWFSGPDLAAAKAETALIDFARSRYTLAIGREYFRNADFEALVDHARSLLSGATATPTLLDLLAA
jgi:DNA-binding transcriptional regulator YhcF (GntR family)